MNGTSQRSQSRSGVAVQPDHGLYRRFGPGRIRNSPANGGCDQTGTERFGKKKNVTRARAQAIEAKGVADQAQAESGLSSALGRLMLVVEQYPDLKANQNFMQLQEELTSTENRIGFSRQAYNDEVMQFNTRIESFPQNVVAGMFSFKAAEFFELEDQAAREAPQVKF